MNYTFTNKNKRNKDKLLCKNFSKYYFDFLVINNIFQIKNIKNKYNYKTYHKDISFLSGRTKAIITKYGIARTDFKRLMIYHQIPNLKKSSW